MKKTIYIILALIIGSQVFTSCVNDFLDKEPKSKILKEDFFNTTSELSSYAINLYAGILPSHGNWSFGTFGIDQATDNMATPNWDNKYAPGRWLVGDKGGDWNFEQIYKCNYFFDRVLPKWRAGEIPGSEVDIEQAIGEVYFLRAHEYFKRVQAFGDFPILRHTLPDNYEKLVEASKRQPQSEVVRFIMADLDSAAMLMQTASPDGKKNRLSSHVAELLKSRVALYEATWLKYFKGTEFVPNGSNWPGAKMDYNSGYEYQAGNIDNEINWLLEQSMEASKIVAGNYPLTTNNFVLQQSESDASNPYFDMFSAEDLSSYSEVMLWRDYATSLASHNVPVYAQLGNHAVGLTRGMVDGFLMSNGLPIYAPGSGYAGDDSITLVRENRDGRLWLFLKEPGQVNCYKNVDASPFVTKTEPYPNITSSDWERTYSTGYTIRKGLNYDGAQCINGGGTTGSVTFRATEAYLNYIEASYELTGAIDETAQGYWEEIRTRAGVSTDINATIQATDVSQEAKNDWGAYSAGVLIEPTLYNIRRERRCELMAEGLREMDLKRWRAMDQMITTPYHIEGFKLWGAMQNWYDAKDLTYGTSSSLVSDPAISDYLRVYEVTGGENVYEGYKWTMAHYLKPIAAAHFLISKDQTGKSTIYQNPYWSEDANTAPTSAM